MRNKKANNKEQAKQSAVAFTDDGWEDYQHWHKADTKMVEKINDLIDACLADPFKGIGKPEPLKGSLTGLWSRRIDREHRLLYIVDEGTVHVIGCRFHY
jgi:toxin YoeB